MNSFKLVEVSENLEENFKKLYDSWAVTIVGLTPESINDWIQWFDKYGGINEGAEVYHIFGKDMNDFYGLVGTNAYPDDLNIYSIPLEFAGDYRKFVIPMRMQWGGRWFTDIVDNNAQNNH